MKVKPYVARTLFLEAKKRLGADHVQVSAEAAVRLAQALEAYGLSLAATTLETLGMDNADRRRLRLSDLKRLTAEHVEEALDIHGS